jgi:hypothetical protein
MFLHTSFPYPQNTRLKSRKNQGGKAEIDDDEEADVEVLEVAKKAVCTHFVFVHKCVRHVCTHFLSVPTDHPAVYTIMYGVYTHCVCTQMCTSCLYILPFLTHRTPGWRAGRIEVVRQRSTTMKRPTLKSWRWQRRYVHTLFLYTIVLVGFVHTLILCSYTIMYIMFVHNDVPYFRNFPVLDKRSSRQRYSHLFWLSCTLCMITQFCISCTTSTGFSGDGAFHQET